VAIKALLVVEALACAPGCEAHRAYQADHCDTLLELLEAQRESACLSPQMRPIHPTHSFIG
jgi:hypothetical protein